MDAPAVSTRPPSARFLPLLLLLFFGSGCAALIYEIVWLQLLQLVVGSSAVSLGVLLGTYMGGMCLGSILLPRFISARRHPLAVYALIELGIGIVGIVVLYAVPALGKIYSAYVGHGFVSILLRGVLGALCLLPPTFLMGATLPAMARWVESTPQGVSWMGFFYGGNIAGAVFGCLLAGFYLLRVHDMATATFVAAALNGTVALIGFALAAMTSHQPTADRELSSLQAPPPKATAIYVAIALSGLTALGAEVIWTRLLSLLLGGTVYTFSIILAVFLFGLGIGSSIGSVMSRTLTRPRIALGLCQLLLTAAIAWSAYMLNQSLPYWPINPSLSADPLAPWFNFQVDLMRCAWAILPATILWGASFPLALAALASQGQDPGRLVGKVYAANTVGAIFGALGASLVLIPKIGTQSSHHWLILIASLAAVLAFCSRQPTTAGSLSETTAPAGPGFAAKAAWVVLCGGLTVLSVWSVPKLTWGLVAYGRYNVTREKEGELLFVGEGMNSSVAVTKTYSGGARNFHVSGKIEASTEPQDMRLQRMLGHLPALLHPNPKSVLIVGCGAGVTAGSFVVHPGIERIVICELEPLIPKVVATNFSEENHNVVTDKRVQIIYDDARHFILTTREKFDIITSDPIHPWVKGSATLYTKEYFELVKQHLNPGGVVTQWVPLYESTPAVVKSETATFFQVFTNGTIWSNDEGGRGYDVVFLAQAEPTRINVGDLETRLNRNDHAKVKSSLDAVGFRSGLDLLMTYAGQASDLKSWLADAEINRDRNLRLQYLAGMGANLYDSERIFNEMVVHRRFPEDLFVAPEVILQELRKTVKPRLGGN